MLTDIVRKSLERVRNRFELVVVTSERTRQLMNGARATVDNPQRERLSKVALREVVGERIKLEADGFRVDRPPMSDLFTSPPPARTPDEADLLLLRVDDDEDDDDEEE